MPILLSTPPAAAIAISTTSAASSVSKIRHLYCSQSRRLHFRRINGAFLSRVRTPLSFAWRGIISPMATAESDTQAQTQSSIISTARKQALISLSDKKDLDLLGRGLQELG
ncbi:uncharacterized protein LOC110036830 [Phalaenopsis equestris]|uniref:uncharacterized protein LOC110036830 n=1 Tax=Phalaenopsis equestris TaxID=78828 RepID=UPI0009E5B05A|nr:uncharacterized protein LOC110036830 [Phalaenopsis equestris]